MKNERLEVLSDQVRMGIPISIGDAIEVIKYQEQLRENRENTLLRRLLRKLKRKQ